MNPSIRIVKGWGKEVEYRSNIEAAGCSIVKDVHIGVSNIEEFNKLAYLHYRSHKVPVPREIFAMRLNDELMGVIAYSYPALAVKGRKEAVGYRPDHVEINEDWAVISRVIIHPKYRSIGLGSHLIRETLGMQGCRHVELIAVMARYNPFAEKAGMKHIQVSEPDPSVIQVHSRD